jgi:hypothetical protein
MLLLIIGAAMLLGIAIGVYFGFRHQYSATEGTLALLLLEFFFVGLGLLGYGLFQVLN